MDDEIVKRITRAVKSSTTKKDIERLRQNSNIVPAIVKILRGAVNQKTAIEVINKIPRQEFNESVSQIVRKNIPISAPIKNEIVSRISSPLLPPKPLPPNPLLPPKPILPPKPLLPPPRNNSKMIGPKPNDKPGYVFTTRNGKTGSNMIGPNTNVKPGYVFTTRNGKTGSNMIGPGNWTRALISKTSPPKENWRNALIGKTTTQTGRPAPNTGNWRSALKGAPIPQNQKRAINYAGGIPRAINEIQTLPGGASEVARTAEALRLTNGNATEAIEAHGVTPAAINSVRKLGGGSPLLVAAKQTPLVLEGLNTLSSVKKLRRSKMKTPRIAELNRVINAVRKKKLISLVAHDVTKTGKIHENNRRLKKYYKKVIKANILRTPLAKIAKNAAKKRVMHGSRM